MTDTQLLELLGKVVDETITRKFEELGVAQKVKPISEQDAFKKTEQVLWNYPIMFQLIKDKEEQIAEIKANGLRTTSASITQFLGNSGGGTPEGLQTREEAIEGVVTGIRQDILWLCQTLERIDLALANIESDPDFGIIRDYYFKNIVRDEIALAIGVDVKTVSNRKNKLVRKLALHLFPRDVITEMLG